MNIGTKVVFDKTRTGTIIGINNNTTCVIREDNTQLTFYRVKGVLKLQISFRQKLIQLWT